MKMCEAMAQEGHQVVLYAIYGRLDDLNLNSDEQIWQYYGVKERFPIHWLTANRKLRGYDVAFSSVRHARQSGFDLIYTRSPAAAALSSLSGYPTICEIHDVPSGKIGPWLFRLFLLGKGFVRLVAISDSLRRAVSERYGSFLQGKSFIVAPDGVDLERFMDLPSPEEARQQLGIPEAFTVGYSGSFYAGRGIELILDLAGNLPEVQFLLVGGDSSSVGRYKETSAQRGLDNVCFAGHIPPSGLPIYLSACEVLLMPYQRRVAVGGGGDTARVMSPLKLFEYMAANRLIISSDLPVLREILSEQNAVLCDPEDVASWREAICRAKEDSSWRMTLAHQARQDVEQYTWRRRVQRCLGV
ncbi:MAG: glycosyltransferase family 4 protein [candidate division WOR-3 bacterium]